MSAASERLREERQQIVNAVTAAVNDPTQQPTRIPSLTSVVFGLLAILATINIFFLHRLDDHYLRHLRIAKTHQPAPVCVHGHHGTDTCLHCHRL